MDSRRVISNVIVTRPAQEAAHWAQLLVSSGFNAAALPLIEIVASSSARDVKDVQTAWQNLHQYTACMFVSGNAVEHFFKQKRPLAQLNWAQAAPEIIATDNPDALPSGCRFLAPGPGTAAALQTAGVKASQIDQPPADAAQFDSAALWSVVRERNWQGARVLVVRGQNHFATATATATVAAATTITTTTSTTEQITGSGVPPRDWLTQQLQAAGSQVDFVSVYERRAPLLSAAQLELARSASTDGSVWLFSSSEAVANLRAIPALASTNWRCATAIATHPRIEQAARDAGFGVVLASRPAVLEIVRVLRSIQWAAP